MTHVSRSSRDDRNEYLQSCWCRVAATQVSEAGVGQAGRLARTDLPELFLGVELLRLLGTALANEGALRVRQAALS